MPEYNPKNELVKKQYEEALIHGKYRDPKTVQAVWNNINLFEDFTDHADFMTFDAEQAKSFKGWLEKQHNRNGDLLSLSTVRSTLNNLREFFEWLAIHPQYVRKVDGRAVSYLRLSDNANRAARASRGKPPPTLDELKRALDAMPTETEIEKRNRAVLAFMIVTGIRDDALVSLKLKDVDAAQRTVWQDPKHVRTKRRKGIMTRFLRPIMPDAEDIVLDWLAFVSGPLEMAPNDPLFPKTRVSVNPATLSFEAQGLDQEHWANAAPVRDIFRDAFQAVNLPYYNPHLIRKTICKWALKNCSQREFKAISQNIGHDHAMTTYNSYGQLSLDEQLEVIDGIGPSNGELHKIPTNEILAEIARRTGK